ncbi:MAG: SEC-C domain-containing protein [Chloroflexi bacterium]|nr:SEC-C domain-containing protein [Chloroflexota bacterium]
MKSILGLLITAMAIIALVGVSGGLLVLAAYGIGWMLVQILPLSPFEATLLSLIALSVTGSAAWKFVMAMLSEPLLSPIYDDELDDEWDNVKPNDRCPCGSGRKYKNCHGKKNV